MTPVLVVASFGTTVAPAMENITAVEAALQTVLPESRLFRCFTSGMIRQALGEKGQSVDSPAAVLEHLKDSGYECVVLQPTHLLCGHEYDDLRDTVSFYRHDFPQLLLGEPLLSSPEDITRFANILSAHYPPAEDTAIVLFGHGTDHHANVTYGALQAELDAMGRRDMVVGTVEGTPSLEDVVAKVRAFGVSFAHLVPIMLVNGDHVRNDMAGDGNLSWKSVLELNGLRVSYTMSGLGVLPEIQQMYADHLRKTLEDAHVL